MITTMDLSAVVMAATALEGLPIVTTGDLASAAIRMGAEDPEAAISAAVSLGILVETPGGFRTAVFLLAEANRTAAGAAADLRAANAQLQGLSKEVDELRAALRAAWPLAHLASKPAASIDGAAWLRQLREADWRLYREHPRLFELLYQHAEVPDKLVGVGG